MTNSENHKVTTSTSLARHMKSVDAEANFFTLSGSQDIRSIGQFAYSQRKSSSVGFALPPPKMSDGPAQDMLKIILGSAGKSNIPGWVHDALIN